MPKHAQEIWVSAFNSAYKQYGGDEEKANKVAWAAVKKKYIKNEQGEWSKMATHDYDDEDIDEESKYEGKKVKLNKPFRTPGGPKKFSVYVRNAKGNVVKVNFGDPNMEIKRDDAKRRKSFRARHNCSDKTDKTKPGYWSCRMWEKGKTVSSMTKATGETTAGSLDAAGMTVSSTFSGKKKKKKKVEKMAETKKPYGDVIYADPGYRDNKKRYPLDTEEHVRAAWSYINMPKNAKFYSADQLKKIKSKIMAAGKKYNIDFQKESKKGDNMKTSKFAEGELVKKVNSIIETLKEKATNKKPEDEVAFNVKSISLLIQDLEEVAKGMTPEEKEEKEEEKKEEKKEKKKEKETKEEKTGEEKEEKKDEEETTEEKEKAEEEDKEEETKKKEKEKAEEEDKEKKEEG